MTITQTVLVTAAIAIVMLVGAFFAGRASAHSELLAECKGPERGIRLYVGNKQYFYYCSYVKP